MSDPKSTAIDEVVEAFLSLVPETRDCVPGCIAMMLGKETKRFCNALWNLHQVHEEEQQTPDTRLPPSTRVANSESEGSK